MPRSRFWHAAALAGLIVGPALLGATRPATRESQGQAPTPLQLFQKLLPVVRHPRCSNCHGGVDPIGTGQGHGPGRINPDTTQPGGQACTDCHDLQDWGLPARDHFFLNRSDKELCGLFANFASRMGNQLFITNHLRGDDLIKAAFDGDAAGARTDPPDKPPQNQEEFITLARDWLERGQGACEVEGTIVVEESVDTTEAWHPLPNVDASIEQHGKRTVTINVGADGKYHATMAVSGTIVMTQLMHAQNAQGVPCNITSITTTTYTGGGSGLATVVAKDTAFFADTHRDQGQSDYRIDVTLPPETTHNVNSGSTADACGSGLGQPDGDAQDFKSGPSTFTLEGHLDSPANKNLVGSCDKKVRSAEVGSLEVEHSFTCNRFRNMGNRERPWLMDHGAGASNQDGSDVPFRVVSHWNLRYRK